ncbi:enoyl-CoA delta isomerase 2, peroxisomal-like [Salvia miltiorrhiza]|uniref:enoyl-CoA delta isomerase 2, peroxisomal-like n=1 Tax=Salvia miltiorrhiza TaxID=226208 RepID=UPI0025ABE082|nr:enoyl-CoA delta isomerase 2, peroxisomal-like [Salvia miltiorrhiza]XP_057783276.1 enoyl-CoA delta isomerase 2, peroxisomal-like [Salvia miltiorrhiza]XP_057783277.1 enoyl-CoA delta isomerase 2, peroxisomal-like [Salvia miltiorrhiza]
MCTLEKRGSIFFLTLTGATKKDQEHRLNPPLIAAIRAALAEVRSQAVPGSALITQAEGRFFSNGFDLRHAQAVGAAAGSADAAGAELLNMVDLFRGVVADLLSLPMPTVAAVTGHAAAAGLILAMSHDYVVMKKSRAVLYLSELDIGMSLPDYFTALIKEKVGSSAARRELALRAAKVDAEAAVRMGIVDAAYDSAEDVAAAAVRTAEELGKKEWSGEAYAEIRKSLYPDVCSLLGLEEKAVMPSKL